jgi:hypothetical protein
MVTKKTTARYAAEQLQDDEIKTRHQPVSNNSLKIKPDHLKTFEPLTPASLDYVMNKFSNLINLGYTVKHVHLAYFLFTFYDIIPNVIVFDNFYKNPDQIREYALKLEYQQPENHGAVGYRCESGRMIPNGTKEFFEKVLRCKIPNGNKLGQWDYSTNGCFQWCNKDVPLVYHADSQEYAGIIYLTPDAPLNTGTSFLRHKKYKSMLSSEVFKHSDWHDQSLEEKDFFIDKSPWETVDSIGNVYNRLVLFKATNIHAVTEYFGENIHNSRLFQLFFFNLH